MHNRVRRPRPLVDTKLATVMSAGAPSSSSSLLTPTAAAEAHKHQEQRWFSHTSTGCGSGTGSSNDSRSGGERTPKIGTAPFSDMNRAGTGEEEGPDSPVPYHMVLGRISGRLVAVGRPTDTLLEGYHVTSIPNWNQAGV